MLNKTKQPTRKTGIDILGDMPWGTHFCQFYQGKEDLIEILVPYFKAGLENNEFCMWVTAKPLNVEDAKSALKAKVKDLDDYIKKGQIEILDYSQWYTKTGRFEADKVLAGWVEKEKQAIERGFDGLRFTGNTFWLEKKDWENFADYEAIVNSVIGKHRMLAVCSYSLDKCQAGEVIEVVDNHQFALIRKEGKWILLRSSERKQVEEALWKSERENAFKAELLRKAPVIAAFHDKDLNVVWANQAYEEATGLSVQAMAGKKCYSVWNLSKPCRNCPVVTAVTTGKSSEAELTPQNQDHWPETQGCWLSKASPVFDEEGKVIGAIETAIDITERKQAEEQLKKLNHDMAERIKELNCIFGLSELIEQYGVDTEQVFKGLVDLISPTWQYPDITCTRIIFENREFKTTNFKPTKWLQSADINIAGKKVGLIEICYLEEMPAIDEGPFLAQERKLLDAIAHRLGKLIEHRKTTEQIKAVNQQLRASNQQLQATEQQLRAANQQLRGEEQQLKALTQQLRASNQQLQATEQQLRAANQQLKAEGQQLKALNQQLRADEEQLKKNHEQLRALAFKLSSIEERERKHIAEGIHGGIIQPLVFLDVKVKSLGKITKDTKLTEAYRQMRTILGELIEKSRTFTFDLSYPILYELGLEPAIEEWLRTEIKDKHKIAVEFKSEIQSKDLDQNIVTFLFKSVKELLINVVKHAKANNVKVSVARKQNNIILCVEDDGCGFESFRSGKKQTLLTGFGLFNIREQVTYLGGELSIDSKAGIGSKITLTVPLEDKA
jgi:PAS domain-containing protein/signal transduction histidine kinase